MDLLIGGIVLLLLFMGKGSNGKRKADTLALPKPPPGPKPKPAKPAKPAAPGEPVPADLPSPGLTISADCKQVTEAPGWLENVARPRAALFVAQGLGLPRYTPAQADRSLDAVVRTIVAEAAGVACVDDAPWLDRYIKSHPIPIPQAGETTLQYFARLDAWDDAWDAQISAWAGSHPQLFKLFQRVGAVTMILWSQGQGIDLGRTPVSGQGPKGLTATDATQLLRLGYDIDPFVVERFQGDYNTVRDHQTDFGWTTNGLDILVDNIPGPQTRYALGQALAMAPHQNQWLTIRAAAEA